MNPQEQPVMIKKRILSLATILGGLIVFILLLLMAFQVSPAISQTESSDHVPAVSTAKGSVGTLKAPDFVLYDQTDNPDGDGFISQEFEDTSVAYNSQGADDFTVPITESWIIDSVDIFGNLDLWEPFYIPEVDFYIHTDENGLPHTEVFSQTGAVPVNDDLDGSFSVPLTPPVELAAGTYWLSVVVDMDHEPNDNFWHWSTRSIQSGNAYAWRNPGGGRGIPECIDWDYGATVCGFGGGPDALFRLNGFPEVLVPEIEVEPGSIESLVPPDTQITQTLTISNVGNLQFSWTIAEDIDSVAYKAPSTDGPSSGSTDLQQHAESNVSGRVSDSISYSGTTYTVLNQLPNQVGGFISDISCGNCSGDSQSMADNFSLRGAAIIQEVVIWGGYNPLDTQPPDDFTVVFHEDDAGLPGAPIEVQTIVSSMRITTGVSLVGVSEWMATLSLDPVVQLGAGNYWVEIFNDTESSYDDYIWEYGDPDTAGGSLQGIAGSGTAPGSDWGYIKWKELAIQLIRSELACDNPEDLPWLSAAPSAGTIPPGSSTDVEVIFDSTGLSEGVYTGTLCVNSSGPITSVARVPLTLTVNVPPNAGFTYSTMALSASFTDTSTDSDGTLVSWDWDFGDSNTSAAQNPTHDYATAGTYNVSLTVTDNDGATDSTSKSVTVTYYTYLPSLMSAPDSTTRTTTAPVPLVSLVLPFGAILLPNLSKRRN